MEQKILKHQENKPVRLIVAVGKDIRAYKGRLIEVSEEYSVIDDYKEGKTYIVNNRIEIMSIVTDNGNHGGF